ncbi:MAG: hypothetical protein ACEQR8_07620, partial [Cypionkella sp.]
KVRYLRKTADGQVKATAGFIHTVSIAPTTATPTAGLLSIYDNAAETGTVVFSEWVFATTQGHSIVQVGEALLHGRWRTVAIPYCLRSNRSRERC